MKRMLVAGTVVGALALAAGGRAFAADLPPAPMPPPRAPAVYVPAVIPVYNWTGIYVGINGGYGFGNSDWTVPAALCGGVGCATGNFTTNGFLIGGTLGANYQFGQFVIGIETDADWTDIKGSTGTANVICPGCQTSNEWLGTTRARAGFAWDRALIFATGGVAYGDVKATPPAFIGTGSDDTVKVGWTAGAGVEFAFTENLTAKLEYLYVDLQNGACTTACGTTTATPVAVSFNSNIVRAGVNFKFGGF